MHLLRLITFICLFAASAVAQEVPPLVKARRLIEDIREAITTKPGFNSIAEVNRVFTTPGSAERAVKFSGIVIQSVPSQNYVFVQEVRGQGIQVTLAKGVPAPALGDEVEVEAMAKFVVANGDTTVAATSIRVTGHPGVKHQQKPTLADIRAGKLNRQAVVVDAVVQNAFFNKTGLDAAWWLLLSDKDGTCLGGIYAFPEGWKPDHLIGKKVRFSGIGVSGGDFILRCSSPDEVQVLGDADKDGVAQPLVTAKEVMGSDRTKATAVVLKGVCTYSSAIRTRFFFHDGTGGLQINCVANECPMYGDAVTIMGTTTITNGNLVVGSWTVEVNGKAPIPEPLKIRLNETPPPPWAAWVEIDGVVISSRENPRTGSTMFYLVGDNNWTCVSALSPPQRPASGWWGARVRMRGVYVPEGGAFIHAWSQELVTVVEPGRPLPFDFPLMTAAALKVAKPAAERVRMTGTVTDFNDSQIYLRDETGSFHADIAVHFQTDASLRALPGAVPWPGDPKPGDRLELVGSPMAGDGTLRFCNIRIIGNGPAPLPRSIKVADAANGASANDLVVLRGRLVNYTAGFVSNVISRRQWREALHLDDGHADIEVVFENAAAEHAFEKFTPNDLIEATGIVRAEGGTPAFRLRIRSIDDVRSLGPDPSIARGKIIRIGIVASIALAAALTWVWLTRRTVTLRTAQLAAANKQLDVALAQEREIGELKSRFVSLVSHEFRTPLGVTMSAVELLRHYRERLPAEELDQLLGDIHSATVRMSAMMEQVLLLGRAEAGKLGFQKAPIILAELTDKLRDETISASNGKCPLQYTVENDVSGASGDEALLRHIFSNLLSNAVKYSPEGSPVEFRVARIGNNAVFTVKDSGIGIPEKDQARLFEAFHRAGNVGEREGTGLGLLIVKRCVELQSGTIAVESTEGKGTTFVVTLPVFDT